MSKNKQMKNTKQTIETKEVKTEEVKTEAPKPKTNVTNASIFRNLVVKAKYASYKDLAKKIIEDQHSRGQTHNIKGKEITLPCVTQEVKAIIKHIRDGTPARWSGYSVVEDANGFKVSLKEEPKKKE